MAKYTIELRTIIDTLQIDIFDFVFNRSVESKAVVTDEALKEGFIRHFYFNEIGQETIDKFKYMLQTQWLESLGELDKLLVAYSKPINYKANFKTTSSNVGVSNDTPNGALDFGAQSHHASFIQNNTGDTEGYAGQTESDLLENYHKNIRDIQTEFYDSFTNLFMQIL